MPDIKKVLLLSFDENQKDYIRKLKSKLMMKDTLIKVYNLTDVQNTEDYAKLNSFDQKLRHCINDCNRVLLIVSEQMAKAVDKNEFPDGSVMENAKYVFREFIDHEKTYPRERSKIILIDLFNDNEAPITIQDLFTERNLFVGERIDKRVLESIWSKCKSQVRIVEVPLEEGGM